MTINTLRVNFIILELEFQEEKEVCSTHDLDRLVAVGLLEKRC